MNDSEPQITTRDRILLTAQRLFHLYGYNSVGINTLCREADVVKGSFYHFFPSKQALLDAVIERNGKEVLDAVKSGDFSQDDGRSRVLEQFSVFLARSQKQQDAEGKILGCQLGTLASELSIKNGPAGKASKKAFARWLDMLEELIQIGVGDGSIAQTVDSRTTAMSLLATLQGMSTLGRSFNDQQMLTEIAQTTVKRLLPVRTG
jgi:TetR/AcrR family transcriptional repressor of nem operon